MSSLSWPAASYKDWTATCDTLHAHTQVLGKLAAELAPPEPQLQHAALRLTARGWETAPLPAPDGSGALVVALDLRTHEAVVEHSDGRVRRAPAHARPVGRRGDAGAAGRRRRARRRRSRSTPRRRRSPGRPARRGHRACHLRPDQVADYFAAASRGRARARRLPCPLPRPLDPGQRLVGLLRPRRQPVLRPPRRAPLRGLHHAQRDGLAGGGAGLVARRRALRTGGVLRLRASGPGRIRGRATLDAGGRPLGRRPRRVRARLGRRSHGREDPHAYALEFARSASATPARSAAGTPTLAASADGTPPPIV